jgi:hypothetical protein
MDSNEWEIGMTTVNTDALAICLEDILVQDEDKRFLCCTVKKGRAGGLSVDNKGTTQWMVDDNPAFQLFFTREDTLGLYRVKNGAKVQVRRGRRTLDVPFEKPVILRHQDELVIARRHYRVHVHGEVTHPYAPYFFKQQIQQASNVAAAVVLGAALTIGSCTDEDTDPYRDAATYADTGTDTETGTETGTDTDTDTGTDTDTMTDTDTGILSTAGTDTVTESEGTEPEQDSETDTDTIEVRLTPPE